MNLPQSRLDYPGQIARAVLEELGKVPGVTAVRGLVNWSAEAGKLKPGDVLAVVIGGAADLLEREGIENRYETRVELYTLPASGSKLLDDEVLSRMREIVKGVIIEVRRRKRADDPRSLLITGEGEAEAREQFHEGTGLQGIDVAIGWDY